MITTMYFFFYLSSYSNFLKYKDEDNSPKTLKDKKEVKLSEQPSSKLGKHVLFLLAKLHGQGWWPNRKKCDLKLRTRKTFFIQWSDY